MEADKGDPVLDFFDEVWSKVPPVYRQINKEYQASVDESTAAASANSSKESKKQKKDKKNKKKQGEGAASKPTETNISLAELNARANAKKEEMRRINAEKSKEKIKQLTEQHKLDKLNKNSAKTEDEDMDSDDEV